jgi:mRNA-degrading endonuclease toxin of MazEF toxin-antitoxin module
MSDDILFRRGSVYLIRFPLPDQPGRTIHKFAVCLQEGRIVENSPTFTCVLINTFKSQRFPSLSLTDVYLLPEECGVPFGARVICDQIHTVHKSMVIEYRYRLSEGTMREIDQRLLLGIGLVKIEELERA